MVDGRAPGRISGIEESRLSPGLSLWKRKGDFQSAPFLFMWGGALSASTLRASSRKEELLNHVKRTPTSRLEKSNRAESLRVAKLLSRSKFEDFGDHSSASLEEHDDTLLDPSSTALFDRSRRMSDPSRYIDPTEVPYLTLSTRRMFRATGVRLGDFATMVNPRTGRYRHAIIGDSRDIVGVEPSTCLCSSLGMTQIDEAIYLIYPASGLGQGTIPSEAGIKVRGEQLLGQKHSASERSWSEVLTTILAVDSRLAIARPV